MSSGSPIRPTGSDPATDSNSPSRCSSPNSRHSSVRTTPGATTLTRSGASSSASARVSDSIAPHSAAATEVPGSGLRPAVPVVRTTEPPSRIDAVPYFTAV
jgi:hypothetical protein